MAYEQDMVVVWDLVVKGVALSFRGKEHYIDGPFADRKAALAAGEQYCKTLGWRDAEPPSRYEAVRHHKRPYVAFSCS